MLWGCSMVCIGKNIANCSKNPQFLPVMCALCEHCAHMHVHAPRQPCCIAAHVHLCNGTAHRGHRSTLSSCRHHLPNLTNYIPSVCIRTRWQLYTHLMHGQ